MDNGSLAHTRWDCTYHIIIIPKYRRKVMYAQLRKEVGGIQTGRGDYGKHKQ